MEIGLKAEIPGVQEEVFDYLLEERRLTEEELEKSFPKPVFVTKRRCQSNHFPARKILIVYRPVRSGYFLILVILAAGVLYWGRGRELDQKLETRKRELLLDYPEIVNKLVLYSPAFPFRITPGSSAADSA